MYSFLPWHHILSSTLSVGNGESPGSLVRSKRTRKNERKDGRKQAGKQERKKVSKKRKRGMCTACHTIRIFEKFINPSSVQSGVPSSMKAKSVR